MTEEEKIEELENTIAKMNMKLCRLRHTIIFLAMKLDEAEREEDEV